MLAERFNLFEYRGNWKYPDPLIVQPNMLPNKDGDNINGPSLIKVPNWVKNPLGKYYLYFSHHDGKYIRMAYSNNIEGPYTSITIVFGFSILVLSKFIPTIYFGVFTGLAMLLAMISVLTLLPALILVIKPFNKAS